MQGEVTGFAIEKGFGFIKRGCSRPLFFHVNQAIPNEDGTPLQFPTGCFVEFELGNDKAGRPTALNVRKIEPEEEFGTVKFFNGEYGFIQSDAGGKDVHFGRMQFVGDSTCLQDEGDRVRFIRSTADPRGPEAYSVELMWDGSEEPTEESVWDKHDAAVIDSGTF